MMQKQHGFTLLEIMLALLIFAILAVITSTVLYTVFNARNTTKEDMDRLSHLQLTLSLLQRDVSQMVSYANPNGTSQSLSFVRMGFINPLARSKRSHLQRVRYVFSNKQLIRESWPRVDALPSVKITRRVLLDNIKQLQFNYLTADKSFVPTWPSQLSSAAHKPQALPQALQINLVLNDWGATQLLLRIPAGGKA